MRFLNKTLFVFKEAFKGMSSSFWKFIVCFVSFILFISVFGLYLNGQNLSNNLRDKIEVSIYLEDNVTEFEIEELHKKIKHDEDIKSYSYVSKEDAKVKAQAMFSKSPEYLEATNMVENPYPASFELEIIDKEKVHEVALKYSEMPGITNDGIKYGEEYTDKLLGLSNGIKYLSLGLLVFFFSIATFFLISMIHVVISSREDECSIMYMIGASPLQIKAPFYLQGAFIGLLTSALAYGIFYLCYESLYNNLSQALYQIGSQHKYFLIWTISLGLFMGIFSTFLALNKFNKKKRTVTKKRKS